MEPTNTLAKKFVQFVANVTPPCHEITRLLSKSMDGRLPLRTRLLIRLHFTVCIWCKRYAEQLKFLRQYNSSIAEKGCENGEAILSPSARNRLKNALEKAKVEPD